MKTRDAAQKVRMGHEYTSTDGSEWTHMGADCWAVMDEQGRVREEGYSSRYAAQAAAVAKYGTEGEPQWPARGPR